MIPRSFTLGLLVAPLLSMSASATLLVGFHDFGNGSNDADFTINAGWSGAASISLPNETTGGSNDNLYGDSAYEVLPGSPSGATNGPTQDGHSKVQAGNNLSFSMTNDTGSNYSLASFLFDVAYKESAASTLTVNWDIAGTALSGSQVFQPTHQQEVWAAAGDYSDFALDLIGVTLEDTQTINFEFSTTSGSGETFRVDNIALAGLSAIPEPASMLALCGLMTGGLFMRNRRGQVAPVAMA